MKPCSVCGIMKPLTAFYKDTRRDGYCAACQDCFRARQKAYSRSGKAYAAVRRHVLKKKYHITEEQYDAMHEAQQHRCASCAKPQTNVKNRFAVDWCAATNTVRGLLCSNCVCIMGLVHADATVLDALAAYLRARHIVSDDAQ